MRRLNATRIVLLVLLAFAVAEYYWLENPRRDGDRWSWFRGTRGCPADPAKIESYGRADYNWKLTALDGRETSLGEFKGRVIFLNMWATWCGPCIEEVPAIQALHDSMRGAGVAFVLVSSEDAETVRGFVEKRGFSLPVFLSSQDLPSVFDTPGIPATYIVNTWGSVVFRQTGAADWDSDACRNFLRHLQQPPAEGGRVTTHAQAR